MQLSKTHFYYSFRAGNENLEQLLEESKLNTRNAMEQLWAEKANVDSKK